MVLKKTNKKYIFKSFSTSVKDLCLIYRWCCSFSAGTPHIILCPERHTVCAHIGLTANSERWHKYSVVRPESCIYDVLTSMSARFYWFIFKFYLPLLENGQRGKLVTREGEDMRQRSWGWDSNLRRPPRVLRPPLCSAFYPRRSKAQWIIQQVISHTYHKRAAPVD